MEGTRHQAPQQHAPGQPDPISFTFDLLQTNPAQLSGSSIFGEISSHEFQYQTSSSLGPPYPGSNPLTRYPSQESFQFSTANGTDAGSPSDYQSNQLLNDQQNACSQPTGFSGQGHSAMQSFHPAAYPGSLDPQWEPLKQISRQICLHVFGPMPGTAVLIPLFQNGLEILKILNGQIPAAPETESEPTSEHAPDPGLKSDRGKYRCCLCRNGKVYGGRGTYKRHVTTIHVPEYVYFCPEQECPWSTFRRDKHHEHMKNQHQRQRLEPCELQPFSAQLPPRPACVVCGKLVNSPSEFWECLYGHSLLSEDDEDQNDRGAGNGDRDNGQGGSRFSPGNGDTGFQGEYPNGGSGNGWSTSFEPRGGSSFYNGASDPGYHRVHDSDIPPLSSSSKSVDAARNPKPASLQEHHEAFESRNNLNLKAAENDPPATGDKANSPGALPARDRTAPVTGIKKPHANDSLPKVNDENKTACRTCGHTITGCGKCENLDGASTRCHRCLEKTSQKMAVHNSPRAAGLSTVLGHDDTGDLFGVSVDLSITFALSNPGVTNHLVKSVGSTARSLELECDSKGQQANPSKEGAAQKAVLGKTAVFEDVEVIPRHTPYSKYLERYVYATRSQEHFLSWVHEALVVSETRDFIISSSQAILYQKAELGSGKFPELPNKHLFYLGREKVYESSDANLKVTTRASPKKRVHLRIRVRVIAGVLALRAAVAKEPPAINSTDTGDSCEIEIPLPSLPTEDDVLMVITWLVQIMVLLFKMPSNPKIYVILAGGGWDIPRLT